MKQKNSNEQIAKKEMRNMIAGVVAGGINK